MAAREKEPTKYWISTMPLINKLNILIKLAKHSWIIVRDYEERQQELRLGTLKIATGAGSTTTQHYVSQLMGSWWPSGTVFPLCPRRSSWIRCPRAD